MRAPALRIAVLLGGAAALAGCLSFGNAQPAEIRHYTVTVPPGPDLGHPTGRSSH